MRKVKQWSRFL